MPAKKILIVDDVKFAVEMARKTLERAECTILTAEDGEEALDVIRKDRPDLILMDIYMPRMSGETCCEILKKDPLYRDIPIIFVTTTEAEDAKEKCTAAGADDFLTKPFHGDVLFRKVQKYIDLTARKNLRLPCHGKVTFSHEGMNYEGELHDLSDGGVFIVSKKLFDRGEIIDMEFTLPTDSSPIHATGEVVRIIKGSDHAPTLSGSGDGMGVRFVEMSEKERTLIKNFTHHL